MATIQTIDSGDTLEPTSRNKINTNFANLNTDKIEADGVTYANLNANGDVGSGATQVAQGDHAHSHGSLSGITANDHHSEAHTIVSHSDTTATGAELDTLTDGSNADALHVHASPVLAHSATTGQTTDDHHAKLHAADHSDGGADELKIENLGAISTDTAKFFQPDGAGGVQVATPAGGGGGGATPINTLSTYFGEFDGATTPPRWSSISPDVNLDADGKRWLYTADQVTQNRLNLKINNNNGIASIKNIWSNDMTFSTALVLFNSGGGGEGTHDFYIGLGARFSESATDKWIGLRWRSSTNQLYAQNHDGTTLTETLLAGTYSNGDDLAVTITFTSGTDITYSISENGGADTVLATHTTNLPTGDTGTNDESFFWIAHNGTGAGGAGKSVGFDSIQFMSLIRS